jgi:hypothetical protein
MMFSDGRWNYVLHPGPGKRIARAVRADGKEIHRERESARPRPSRAA